MREIVIEMKDGTSHRFEPCDRAGGSYGISVRYEGEWVIVKDEWGNENAYPACDVKTVTSKPFRSRW